MSLNAILISRWKMYDNQIKSHPNLVYVRSHCYMLRVNDIYSQCTCSSLVETFINNKHVLWSRRVYFLSDSNSTNRTFFSSLIKRNAKINPDFSKVLEYLKLHYMHAIFIYHVCLRIDRRSRVWWNIKLCTSIEIFSILGMNCWE